MGEPERPEKHAREIVRRLQEAGFTALFAGGCVRDRLLGREPMDFDIATSARPEEVQALFRRTVAVGAQFGVICVMEKEREYQVATFRSDQAYIDGRHPSGVVFSSAEQDAERRDFTINGLFYDPIAEKLIDYVGGQADLKARRLRAIGEATARFDEDRLRLLRAVRFAATLELEIDPATWAAVCEKAPSINSVSAERIREELVKIFRSKHRVRGFDLLDRSGLMRAVLPEVDALKGCEQPPEWHPEGDVFVHTRLMLELLPAEVSLPLVFSVLFHDIGKPGTYSFDPAKQRIRFSGHDKVGARMTEEVMTRLRFPRTQIEAVVEAVDQHMVFKDVRNMRVAKLKRFMSRPHFEDELALHWADCSSSHRMLDNYEFLKEKQEEFAQEPLIPRPLIDGHDLIARGFKPGPALGKILEAVQTRQLEGMLEDREAALNWVASEYSQC